MSIQNKMIGYLTKKNFKIDTILGFNDEGGSALILECDKGHTHISIELGNESKELRIRGGLHGKYLPKGEGLPKFKHIFKSTELGDASTFFTNCVDWCDKHSNEDKS